MSKYLARRFSEMRNDRTIMTVGELSHRTRIPVRKLRQYADLGLIYTVGRSAAGYRLFGTDALWCVEVISTLRSLGLTEAEIQRLNDLRDRRPGQPIGPHLAEVLHHVRTRTQAQIDELQRRSRLIESFIRTHRTALNGHDDPAAWSPGSAQGL